jgi:trimeric autotransporter adhesin
MRKIYFLLFIVCSIISLGIAAQPTVFYTNLTSTTSPALTNSRLNLADLGAFRQCRFQTTAAPAPATQTYAFHTGTDAAPDYNNNWRPYIPADATGIAYALNTVTVPATVLNSARWNTGGGGTDGNLAALANTTYYTVNIQENAAADNLSAIWSTTFNPVTFSGVTQTPLAGSVNPGNTVTVNITSSAALGTGENVFVRYSTNGFATSSLAQATFVATAGTAVIPGLVSGTNVSYYIFSSNRSLAQLNAIVGTAGIGQAGYDMATLNLINNAGANYSYTVNAGANPITVNASGGTLTADYGSLQTAFDAINAGTHTGAITVLINASTTEAAPSVLNASGTGAASYTSVAVNPAGGGARTIAGAIAPGSPLIDLNGADNVTFDGLNTGGNSLTIENTTVSATSGTSTIRFIGGATGNTITNCSLKGAGTMSVATNGAVVFFSTDAITANGNDNNTISNNDIGPSGANLPTKAILGNGSTSTTAIGNSGITINNNDIHDFFGAAVTSSGVATNGGCNTWTISNNRFYQTATRTWTTGATHRAIDISNTSATSGAQGFTITGNTIGYASNTQTGTYTLTGSTGKFQGIVFSGINAGTVSNINNNTVASVSLSGVISNGTSTSSPLIGILISNGLATTNNNTIGSQSAAGSLTLSTNVTTSTDVYGIFNVGFDNWTSSNNNIGGISVTNAGASGTFLVYGMRANTGTTLTWTAGSNTIGGSVANSIQLNATGASSQVVGMQTPNAISTLTLNTIRNLTSNIGTGTTTAASVAGIIFTSTAPVQTVSQNTIYNLSNTNATAASVVTGIQFTGGVGNVVQRNLIYDLSVATTSATAEVNGIRVGGGTTTYRNNMIRLGAGINNAIGAVAANSSTAGINGLNGSLGTDNFWHNSVYIEGTATAGTGASYAFNGTQTTNTRSFRDNIFFNARSNGGATGSHYAIKLNGTIANPTGLTVNNNVYFANGTGGVFGFYNSTNVANLAAWQAAVGQDAASVEANPLFVSATDLHLQAGSPAIDVAFNLGVANDYDGDTRPGTNALYDIGADERDGIPSLSNDIAATAFINPTNGGSKLQGSTFGPQASFTNNGVNNQTNFSVKYRILDNTLAVIYDQTVVVPSLNSLAATTVTFPNTSIAATGTYTIQAIALLASDQLVTNDTITGTLLIQAPLSGTYTVGSGGNYPSLTNAGGMFETLNNLGASANININIISDLAGETGANAINELAGGYSVNIQPTGGARTVTGSINGPLIKLNGADRVTIDGSTTGASAAACLIGGNAAIRELTFQNTSTGTAAAVIAVQTGTNGAKNNIIKNINVLGQDPTTTLLGISLGGNTPGTVGADNDSNRVENCSVKRTIFGIYAAGASAANVNINTVITQNSLDSTSATDRVRRVGILMFNDSIPVVTYNSITGINTNESADAIGIAMGTQDVTTTFTTSGGMVGALVANNRIAGVASLSTTGFSAAGITIAGGTTAANTVRNNMISGVIAPSTSPDFPVGIFVAGVTGANTRLYFNSVALTGNRGTVTGQMPGFGVAITGTNPVADLKNNILFISQEPGGGGVNARNYAIGMTSTTFTNLSSNYNDFWSVGTQDGGFRTGSLGAAAGTDYAALAGWQTATSQDANSLETNPMFIDSASNLHINPNNCAFKGLGTPITGITDDYDCDTRNAATPDIGADEFVAANATANAGGNQSICGGNTYTVTGASATNNSGVNWTTSGDGTFLNGTTLTPTYTPGVADILAGTVTLTLTATGNAPCANATSNMTLTITTTGVLAGTAGGPQVCQTKIVGIGATYNDGSCNTIATVIPAGGSPVSGSITGCVKVESSIPTYNSLYYVARHYDIEPAVAPSTSSANVTLYFSPAEMAAFNADLGAAATHYPLPVLPTDNTDSVRIEQYHGTGTNPTNYSGALETWSTANGLQVVFSNGYWAITVPVTSFSGFWLTAKPKPPLPVTVEYFRGAKNGSSHNLTWKVSCTNTPFATMTLERSADGRNFGGIYTITASATRCLQAFDHADTRPLNGINYYRLKMADADGKVTYSTIVALTTATKGFEVINITPNPVTEGRFKLNVTSAEQLKMEVVVTDMAGRVVAKQSNTLIAGFNAIDVNVNNLANGTYQVTGITAGGRTKTMQFVKQ